MEAFEIIRKTMPEFKEVEDDTIRIFLSLAEPLISKKRFGKLYQYAIAYLAAHKMKLVGHGETIGTGTVGSSIGLTSISEGEASISFANSQESNTESDAEYGLTIYGMQFLQLKRKCIISIISAGVKHES